MLKIKQGGLHFNMCLGEVEDSLASLKSLLARVKGNQRGLYKFVGICGNWESDFSYALVSHYGSQWPKSAHPGIRHPFPINTDGIRLWEGTNKELRIDLMEFIIGKLEQLIEENPR